MPLLTEIRSLLRGRFSETAYRVLWKLGARSAASEAAHRAIFTRIYDESAWGCVESRSGPGSTRARGADFRPALVELIARRSISTVLDAPCGDFNWMRDLPPNAITQYIGVDVVKELISRNDALYGSDRNRFVCADITRDTLPRADLVICRDALIHFSLADVWSALSNLKRSGSTFLLATSFIDIVSNQETRTGGWRRLNLQAPPFCFPEPLEVIDDAPRAGGAGKRLCLWKFADLGVRSNLS